MRKEKKLTQQCDTKTEELVRLGNQRKGNCTQNSAEVINLKDHAKESCLKKLKQMNNDSVAFINGKKIEMSERTSAKDYFISDECKSLVLLLEKQYGKETAKVLEDSLRGFSTKMQEEIGMRIMDYQIFGRYMPTGVKHVDDMLKKMVKQIPDLSAFAKVFTFLSN